MNFIRTKMRVKYLGLLILALLTITGRAQVSTRNLQHIVSFKTQFLQIKDGYNYGLAHSGLNLAGAYTLNLSTDRGTFSYETEIAFGINYNQGLGMAWSFKPFDFYYGFRLNDNPDLSFMLGPYLSGYYKWQLYPELQSGHMLWFSSYELGPELWLTFPLGSRIMKASLASSLAGFTSRPQTSPEVYFYSLTFHDFVSNVHSNMTFGSLDRFRHLDIQLILLGKNSRRTIGYEFEYISYSDDIDFQYMIHSVNLTWQVGNKKKN